MKRVLFFYSGKGGVGKSTIACNCAFALASRGYKIGIIDADFNTPSVHRLISGIDCVQKAHLEKMKIQPAIYDNLLLQSTGFFNSNTGIIWNEDYIDGALFQLLDDKLWDVDFLVVDMPPSINKIHISLCQRFPNAELVFVNALSVLSIEDSNKAYNMAKTLGIKIIGNVFNMSALDCEKCNHKNSFYEEDEFNEFACFLEKEGFIEYIPFSKKFLTSSKQGIPIVKEFHNDLESQPFFKIADYIIGIGI